MGMNQIQLITKYSTEAWDTVYKQESVMSLLDANPKLVKFEGAKTVKIGKYQAGGLHDYYRNNTGDGRVPTGEGDFLNDSLGFGYQKSGMKLVWEEFTLRADRAAAIPVEMFDNEESGEELVGLGVSEFSRTVMVPEIDAYGLSTIASYCTTALGNLVEEDITDKPLASLNNGFEYMEDHEVQVSKQIAFVSPEFIKALRNTTEVTKFLGQTDYSENKDTKFTITTYEGRKLVHVSPERLRTDIDMFGREGYGWKSTSKKINFLLVATDAVMHVVKYEKVKVIGGDMNLAGQGFDGYTIFARVYHDVFVPENKRVALYCSVKKTGGEAPALTLEVTVKDGKVAAITTVPGDRLVFIATSAASVSVGGTLTGYTIVNRGDKVESGAKFYAIDSNAKVLATYTAPSNS